jgi:hypothetical protein
MTLCWADAIVTSRAKWCNRDEQSEVIVTSRAKRLWWHFFMCCSKWMNGLGYFCCTLNILDRFDDFVLSRCDCDKQSEVMDCDEQSKAMRLWQAEWSDSIDASREKQLWWHFFMCCTVMNERTLIFLLYVKHSWQISWLCVEQTWLWRVEWSNGLWRAELCDVIVTSRVKWRD